MHPLLFLAVFALIAVYLLEAAAALLGAGRMPPGPPPRLAGRISRERHEETRAYVRERARLDAAQGAASTLLVVGMLLFGGFDWLDQAVRSAGLGPVPAGLAFFGALGLGAELLGLPFALYSTFVVEARHGFNTTTPATFALDRLKGWLLTALLGGALLAALLWFLGRAGPLAWVWCWLAASGFSLAMALLGPTLLLPLFNRFTPLEPGVLREGIEDMAARAGFRLSGIFVMDGSRRSTKGNAFFTGMGPTRRIALFDTLVDAQSTEETVGVLAHEIGHSRLGHIRKRLLTGVLKTGALLWLVSLFLEHPGLQMALGMSEPSVHAGLLLFGVLFAPLSLPLSMLSAAVSRHHEFQADAFAARLTGQPGALASALAGLAARNKTNLTPHPLEVWLHHSHPPVLQRLARLEAMEGPEELEKPGPAGTSGPNGPKP